MEFEMTVHMKKFSKTLNNILKGEFCSKVVKHWIDVYASKASLEVKHVNYFNFFFYLQL